jgi:hypothetical protein
VSDTTERRRRLGGRRALAAGTVVVALVALGALSSRTGAGRGPGAALAAYTAARAGMAAPASRPATKLTASSCPSANYPHRGDTRPYEIPFTGTLSSTLDITSTPVGAIDLPPVTGSFCGVIQLPQEQAVVEPANLNLSSIHVRIARATVPSTIDPTGNSIGTITGQAANGGIEMTLAVPVAAGTGLFGVDCKLPVDLDLSTTFGQPITGPLAGSSLTVTQSGFTVQPAVSTGASGTCPSYLARQIDNLIALPNNHTTASANVTLDINILAA